MKRILTALVLGISLLVASGGGGYSQDYQKGLEAAQKGNYAVAYWEWTVAAEQGDAVAQLFLGQMFFEGLGVLQDYKVAKMWLEKSASKNISMAQNNLGSIYENGKGVAQDLHKAAIWYQKAAVQGDKNAQFNLGAFYFDEGGDLNLMYSYMWFKISLENGVNIAKENVDFLKTKMSSSHVEKADFFIYECLKKQRGCLERLAHMTFNPLTQNR